MHTPGVEKVIGTDEESIDSLAPEVCKGRVDLAAGACVGDLDLQSEGGAAACTSFTVDSAFGALAGLTRTATRAIPGTISRSSPSRFAASSAMKKLTPVALPPGRARLSTRP